MNVFWPEGLQKLADKGEISFKDGERLNLNLVRKMDNGLYLISLKGKSFTAQLQFEPQGNTLRAEVVRSSTGAMQLKLIPKAENSGNPMRVITQTVQTQTQGAAPSNAATASLPGNTLQRLIFQLPSGTIDVKPGDQVQIQILKTLDNGNTLVAIKNNLFEVKLDHQLLKNLSAEVLKNDVLIELAVTKAPVENLNQNFVKQEVAGLDIVKLMRAFGKFQKLDVSNITADSLKQAVRNSGLFMENKLLHGENMSGDEKLRAYINSDMTAKEGITKIQITNMLLAGGLLAFLKTSDEAIDDTYVRMKKDMKGKNTLYVSTSFSQLGETLMVIRDIGDHHDVIVKTEVDISEELKDVEIENVRIRWYKFSHKDKEVMDIKKDISFNMGNFEVII
ncbi:MAG: hypothetical protein C0602_04290 [Denitrovibrio sp.]|nr:MAG: hypothetical protein C0602_04290 [Denitrovibrio sp.]